MTKRSLYAFDGNISKIALGAEETNKRTKRKIVDLVNDGHLLKANNVC